MLLKIRSFNVLSFVKLLFYRPPWALEHPESSAVELAKSPKSVAFPADAIVIKSIIFILVNPASCPPANTPVVVEDAAATFHWGETKSPKSVALPADAIVTN
jgi:hypothetical protein